MKEYIGWLKEYLIKAEDLAEGTTFIVTNFV
jgi:hypothetical protein